MKDMLVVGEVLKPQGVTGSIKVKPYVDDVARFKKLHRVYIDGNEYRVAKASVGADFVILWLGGVADRNAAELLRGKMLKVDRADAVTLPAGRYFVVDVIGSRVVDEDGNFFGTVTDIASKSYADVYTLDNGGKTVMFPLLGDLVLNVDVENKTVTVKGKRFAEVTVYED